jgi:hypothetical protein
LEKEVEEMKKIFVTAFLVVGLLFGINPANAILLNPNLLLPDILSNQTGLYVFNSSSRLITYTATPLTISFDGINLIDIAPDSNGGQFYLASFKVDAAGNFAGGVIGHDLEIVGAFGSYDGTLLTGEINNFGFLDVPGPLAIFDYTFVVTGGILANEGYFGALGGGIALSEVSSVQRRLGSVSRGYKSKAQHGAGGTHPLRTLAPWIWADRYSWDQEEV